MISCYSVGKIAEKTVCRSVFLTIWQLPSTSRKFSRCFLPESITKQSRDNSVAAFQVTNRELNNLPDRYPVDRQHR